MSKTNYEKKKKNPVFSDVAINLCLIKIEFFISFYASTDNAVNYMG
jgi:hypothetical protein